MAQVAKEQSKAESKILALIHLHNSNTTQCRKRM